MKVITYDKKADAAYIKLTNKNAYQHSKKLTDDVLVDYAKDGTVVGIEILDASKNMALPLAQNLIRIESV